MNQILNIAGQIVNGARVVDTPEGLSEIHKPDCAAAIWQRRPLPEFQSWIDALAPEQLPTTRITLRPERVCEALQNLAQSIGTPAGPERDMLIDDIAALAAIFAKVMDAPYLRLRLDAINTNACRKFHLDAITARLVCTYRGTGTQYGIGRGGEDPQRVFTVPTGAPVILRGSRWPVQLVSGLLHRSPPIEGSGETRLLLVLDPVADLESDPDPIHPTLH